MRHFCTIQSEHARKIRIDWCKEFLLMNVCLHPSRMVHKHLVHKKHLTLVCLCSHPENPKRQLYGLKFFHWLSLVEGLNGRIGLTWPEHCVYTQPVYHMVPESRGPNSSRAKRRKKSEGKQEKQYQHIPLHIFISCFIWSSIQTS